MEISDTMGEDKLVVMLGGLHRELAVLKATVSWLLGSGWTEADAQARITTTGRAESLVTSAHYYVYKIRPSNYGIHAVYTSAESLHELLRTIRREPSSIP